MTDLDDDLDDALASARSGMAGGFRSLFNILGAPVAGYARARGVTDPDDLANEVFLRAFRGLNEFSGDAAHFRAWVFTIAHHAVVDHHRRLARRPPELLEATPRDVYGGDVEDDVLARLAQERVSALLSLLPPDQRDVLLLRVVTDLSIEQTATVLEKSYEAVKALQRRALARLRRGTFF